MGAITKNASYLRFKVAHIPTDTEMRQFEENIQFRQFKPLLDEQEELSCSGWAPLEAPFDDERKLIPVFYQYGSSIALAYREDKLSIPKPLLLHLQKKKIRQLEKEGKEVDKHMEEVIKLSITSELKQRLLPKSRIIDVVWDLDAKQVRVFGRGSIVHERLSILFEQTFLQELQDVDHVGAAGLLDLPERAKVVLEQLQPIHMYDS